LIFSCIGSTRPIHEDFHHPHVNYGVVRRQWLHLSLVLSAAKPGTLLRRGSLAKVRHTVANPAIPRLAS